MGLQSAEVISRETTVAGVLRTTCVELTAALDAQACSLSRVIGQLLVDLVAHAFDGRRMQLGRSYLVPDYPVTQEVIDSLEARRVSLLDAEVDAGEAAILRELDFDALLMLPFVLEERCWGLVEVYRTGTRPFDETDVANARAIIEHAAEAVARLQRHAAAA